MKGKRSLIILKKAIARGAGAQLIGPSELTQKPQLTCPMSLGFCANSPNLSNCTLDSRPTAFSIVITRLERYERAYPYIRRILWVQSYTVLKFVVLIVDIDFDLRFDFDLFVSFGRFVFFEQGFVFQHYARTRQIFYTL